MLRHLLPAHPRGGERITSLVPSAADISLDCEPQAQETFRILGHLAEKRTANTGTLHWGICAGAIFLSAVRIARPKLYIELGKESVSYRQIFAAVSEILSKSRHADWWMQVLAAGAFDSSRENEWTTLNSAGIAVGLFPQDSSEDDARKSLSQFFAGWGGSFRLNWIHNRIEALQDFGL